MFFFISLLVRVSSETTSNSNELAVRQVCVFIYCQTQITSRLDALSIDFCDVFVVSFELSESILGNVCSILLFVVCFYKLIPVVLNFIIFMSYWNPR